MKLFARTLLMLTLVSTLAIYFFWKPAVPAVIELSETSQEEAVVMSEGTPSSSNATANPVEVTAPAQLPAATVTNFDWSAIESSDYKQYIANLRALGIPEEGIRALIIADVNKAYEPRETVLREKVTPDDQPADKRWAAAANPDLERLKQLREVLIEKQANLKDLLGVYVPREFLRLPASRNYDAIEYALNEMPESKRDAVQALVEDLHFANDLPSGPQRFVSLEDYIKLSVEFESKMQQVLTPQEFKLFQMNTTPPGTELARCIAGMSPTDAEFAAMFDIKLENWTETGGVYGRWRANKVPQNQIIAADQLMDERLLATLGPERFLDYQLAATELGQELRNLGDRFGLSRTMLSEAYGLQKQLDQMMPPGDSSLQSSGRRPVHRQVPEPIAGLQQQLESVLGSQVWQAWRDYRSLRPSLQP